MGGILITVHAAHVVRPLTSHPSSCVLERTEHRGRRTDRSSAAANRSLVLYSAKGDSKNAFPSTLCIYAIDTTSRLLHPDAVFEVGEGVKLVDGVVQDE